MYQQSWRSICTMDKYALHFFFWFHWQLTTEYLKDDIFKATVHQAVIHSGLRRYSIPLFFGTDYNVKLEVRYNFMPQPLIFTLDPRSPYQVVPLLIAHHGTKRSQLGNMLKVAFKPRITTEETESSKCRCLICTPTEKYCTIKDFDYIMERTENVCEIRHERLIVDTWCLQHPQFCQHVTCQLF